jgi:beta-mannosidase
MNRYFSILLVIITGLTACHTENVRFKDAFVTEISDNWEFRQHDQDEYYPATVPGSVHTDLMANKIIADPYFRLNEKDLQWIDKKDWDYRTIFSIDKELLSHQRIDLVFEGIDTYSKVFLNGKQVLQTDNMFRTWVVDVTDAIRPGENELLVRLESPTGMGKEKLEESGFQLAAGNDQSEAGEMGGNRVSPYVRKAPYHFGWDWGPRLVTSGIWRPVRLRAWSGARIEDVSIVTKSLTEQKAELLAIVEIETTSDSDPEVVISGDGLISEPGTRSASWRTKPGTTIIQVPFTIKNPELWYPNGLGAQKMYTVKVELVKDDRVIDVIERKTGLRTVNLVREADPDRQGESFYFEVNGSPVFAKGANYIPNDVFLNRVTPEKYEFIVKSAADAHMNMLRVWGGGIYENEIFYDLCDKYGIMVWQDFIFACAMYPGDDEFLESVRLEAIDNVKRLRNHPCIVLWCGNNEIEAAWGPYDENRGWGWKQRYNAEQREIIWKAYDTLFHKILPGVVTEFDPGRPYWHSSPSAGMGQLASYETTSGDMHYWGVWHGLHPFSDFRKYRARFMSEYGFQSFPEFNSVKKYALPEDYSIESDVMMAHQRSGIGNLRIRQYMEPYYKIPVDFEQFLYVGQLLQAEAIKLAIESHRSEMPYCMGSLYWQINDCWPVASWSGIDYYGKWKALHYFVKEAYKPVTLVCSEAEGLVKIKVISDNNEIGNWKVGVRLVDFAGKLIREKNQALDVTSRTFTFPVKEILGNADTSSVVLVSELKNGSEIIDIDLHYFVKPKNLKLNDPQVKTEIIDKDDHFEVVVSSNFLAKNVFLYADGLEGQFSDNYFDVLPGDTIIVTIPKTETSIEGLRSLNILNLFQNEEFH